MIAYNILEEILDLADEILATEKHSIVLNIKKMDSNHEVSVLLKAVRRNNNIFNVILQYNNLSGGNGGFAIQDMIKKSKSIINLEIKKLS